MKLVNCELENQIVFEENKINVFVVENKQKFYQYVNVLLNQINNNEEEGFVLSHNNKILNLRKNSLVLNDYFNFNLSNNKIFLNKFYKLLEIKANENYIDDVYKINNKIINLLNNLDIEFNINMIFDDELDFKKLLKTYNVSITFFNDKLLEKIIDFIEVLQELDICNFIIFINLKDYLIEEDIIKFYDYVTSKQFNVLLIENKFIKKLDYEKYLIIDEDLCEIIVDK